MNAHFLIVNELAALIAAPLALLATFVSAEKYRGRILIFGQAAAFVFAFFGSALALSQTIVSPVTVDVMRVTLRFEPVSSCLLTGITFIAAVVVAFSDRYLLGDKTRLNFLRYLSLLSCTSGLLAVTDSMLMAFVCWTALSVGLYRIMRLQDDSRVASQTVLRYHLLSDVALLLAFILIVGSSGVFAFSDLSIAAQLLSHGQGSYIGTAASLLLVLSFCVKAALFPFHKWLLATLDAPTPLSGLLHAGVVNVSAIMAWRLMPVLHEHSNVLIIWALWSALSAIVGTMSMSAQPDVKRKLVFSTTGQMGFMSLQCAIGMPGAAIFHLLAHGHFKCQMFLQSGSAVSEGLAKRKFGYAGDKKSCGMKYKSTLVVCCAAIAFCLLTITFSGWSWTALSAAITAAALLNAIPSLNRVDSGSLTMFCTVTLALALASASGSKHFEKLIQTDFQTNAWLLPAFMMISMALALMLNVFCKSRTAKALYVHSLNGFYASELDLRQKTERA